MSQQIGANKMEKIRIDINVTNSAFCWEGIFEPTVNAQVSRILKRLSTKIKNEESDCLNHAIMDGDGNTIGSIKYS